MNRRSCLPSNINVTKHGIELRHENIQLIHSTPNRPGPKTEKYENVKIDKIFQTNVIEPVENKWAAAIVFLSKKRNTVVLCWL